MPNIVANAKRTHVHNPVKIEDRIAFGQRFGRLVNVGPAFRASRHVVVAAFRCDCGVVKNVRVQHVLNGASRSCGCAHPRTHGCAGKIKTVEYMAWRGMIKRCENTREHNYADYGGRGISVCRRWRNDFTAFLADMGARPGPGYSLDRYPNNNGNYEPGNCRWATATEQANNTRRSRLIEAHGARKTLGQWSAELGISVNTLRGRLWRGWPPERALTP